MADYIKDIRKLVGHRPLICCAGSVIIVNAEGKLLLGRRTDNHLWGYAGGAMELGETVEDCARRELYEEMGIEAKELEYFMIRRQPEELEELRFFAPEEITMEMLSPPIRPVFRKYLQTVGCGK